MTVVVFTVDTSAVPQCWKNAVAKASSDLYHMEASITVFLHRGRQSAVTWPLRPNRISVLHCRLSCSTCSLSVGSVLHSMESMLCPGTVLQRWSRGSSGIFARILTCICYYCQSILKHTTLSSLFICVSAEKYNNCLLFSLLKCIFVFFFSSFLFFFAIRLGYGFVTWKSI